MFLPTLQQARALMMSNNFNNTTERMIPAFNRRLMNPVLRETGTMSTPQDFHGPLSADPSIPDTVCINGLADQNRKNIPRVAQGMKAPVSFIRGGHAKSNMILAQQQHLQAVRMNRMKEMRLRRQQQQQYMMGSMDRFPFDGSAPFSPEEQYNMMMMGLTPDEQAQLLALEEEQAQQELMMLNQQSGGYGGHFPDMETATLYEQQLMEAAAAGDPYAAELLAEDVPYYMADQTFDYAWQTLMPYGGNSVPLESRSYYPNDHLQMEPPSMQPHDSRMNTSYQTHDSFFQNSSHSTDFVVQRHRKQMQQRMMMQQQLQKQQGVRGTGEENVNNELRGRAQQQSFGHSVGGNARNSKMMLMAKLQEQQQLKRLAHSTSMSNDAMNQTGRTSVTNECLTTGMVVTTPHQYKNTSQQTQHESRNDMKQEHTSNLVTPRSSDPRTVLHQGVVDSPFSFFDDDSPIAFDNEKTNLSNASEDGQCINNMYV